MKSWLTSILFILGFLIPISILTSTVSAESLSVSLRVGDTRISFDGYSSPGAYITIKQNSAVIGTTVADSNGNWSKMIDAYNPGIQTFDLYATDTLGLLTPTITYNVNLLANTLTSISNIVFPPTLTSTTLPTSQNDSLVLSGMTHPLSSLTVLISNGDTYPVTPNPDGTWSISISMANSTGAYTVYVTASMPGSYISLSSASLSYTISATPSTTPSSSGTPSPSTQAPSQSLTPPGISIFRKNAGISINPPKKVDISELSTPIQYFYTIARNILNINLVIFILFTIFTIRAVIYFFSRKKKNRKKP